MLPIRPRGPYWLNRGSDQAHGLVAWWPGGYAPDGELSVIGGQNMVRNGPTVINDGMLRSVDSFTSASSHYKELGSAPVTTDLLTMSAWVNTSSAATLQVALSIGDGTTQRYGIGFTAANALQCFSVDSGGTGANAATAATFSTNTWYHLVGRVSSSTLRECFVNGLNLASNTTSRTITMSKTNIGARYNTGSLGSYWNGLIADVRIYNYAVPDSIIWQCYDPATRWDLYWVPRRRVYSFAAPAAATGGEVIGGGVSSLLIGA